MREWKDVGYVSDRVRLHGCVRLLITLALCSKLELDRTRGIRLFN